MVVVLSLLACDSMLRITGTSPCVIVSPFASFVRGLCESSLEREVWCWGADEGRETTGKVLSLAVLSCEVSRSPVVASVVERSREVTSQTADVVAAGIDTDGRTLSPSDMALRLELVTVAG